MAGGGGSIQRISTPVHHLAHLFSGVLQMQSGAYYQAVPHYGHGMKHEAIGNDEKMML